MDCVEIPLGTAIEYESGKHVSHVLISKVLCFVHHHLQNCAPDHVKTVAVSAFTGDEIVAAKKLLWGSYVKEKLKPYQERRTSAGRKLEEANVADIIEAFKDLDQKEEFVHCAVIDIKEFPSFSPERLNTVAMLRRLEMLETRYKDIEDSANKNTIEICNIQESVHKQSKQITDVVNTVDTHGTLINNLQNPSSEGEEVEQAIEAETVTPPSEAVVESSDQVLEEENNTLEAEDSDEDAEEDLPDQEVHQEVQAPSLMSADRTPMVRNGDTMPQSRHANHQPANPVTLAPARNRDHVRTSGQGNAATYAAVSRPQSLNGGPPIQRRPPSVKNLITRSNSSQGVRSKPSLMAHRPRTDSDGFSVQRHQFKQQRKNNLKKIYIGNIDKRHVVEDVIDFLSHKNITVSGLYQRSHYTASKKSFVCLMNDYNFRLLSNERDCEKFEIREYVDPRA